MIKLWYVIARFRCPKGLLTEFFEERYPDQA